MKYIFIKDLSTIIKKHKKLLLFSIIIFIVYVIYINKFVDTENPILYYLGILFDKKYIALISLFIFDYILYIYLIFSIYINNLKFSYDFLFTRMNFSKWNIFKILSLLLILFLFKTIQILIYIIINLSSINILEIIAILINILFTINIGLNVLLLYVFNKKFNIIYSIITILILSSFNINMIFDLKILMLNLLIFLINIKLFTMQKVSNIKIKIGG